MPKTIYDQLNQALGQAIRYGQRFVLYRGQSIECAVLLGNESTRLQDGGLQTESIVHILIPRSAVPMPQDGDPHTNEIVTFPDKPSNGLIPREFMISEVIAQEWNFALTLVDPSR